MARIALMALGQVVGSDIRKSISAFAKLSARDSWLPFYPAHWVMTVCKLQYDTWFGGNIAKYKKGDMTTPEFVTFLGTKFSPKATEQELKDAWNAMCDFKYSEVNSKVREIDQYMFVDKEFILVILGVTNESHFQYIRDQIDQLRKGFGYPTIQAEDFFTSRGKIIKSFEQKTLDVNTLVRKALEGLDVAGNTIHSFIHTAAAIPSMGLKNARVELCNFDKGKTFAEIISTSENNSHLKTL